MTPVISTATGIRVGQRLDDANHFAVWFSVPHSKVLCFGLKVAFNERLKASSGILIAFAHARARFSRAICRQRATQRGQLQSAVARTAGCGLVLVLFMRSKRDIERWLAREVLGREIARKPPGKARRTKNVRDEDYKAWIRTHPCAACGSTYSVECAHVGYDGGASLKASDNLTIPLCTNCHTMGAGAYHRIGRKGFERLHNLNCQELAARLYLEYSQSRITKAG